eukprot:scpid40963/ scgid24770/ Breast cancer anti-estrogen resistance protein 3
MADGVSVDDLPTVGEWLESQGLNKHFPLFVGYADIGALLRFTEADFVRLGVTNANDRRTMLRSLAEEAVMAKGGQDDDDRSSSPGSGRQSPMLRKGSTATVTMKKLFGKGKSPVKAFPLQNNSGQSSQMSAVSTSPASQPLSLEHQPWFHGLITRKQAELAVKKDGDILVRESISKKGSYVLTARWKGQALHFVINRLESTLSGGGATISPLSAAGSKTKSKHRSPSKSLANTAISDLPELAPPVVMYRFERESYPSIVELVNHYILMKQPISEQSGAIAKYPVPRVASSEVHLSKAGGGGSVGGSQFRLNASAKDSQSLGSMEDLLASPPSTSRQTSGTDSVQHGGEADATMTMAASIGSSSSLLGNGIGSPPNMYEMVTPMRFATDSDSTGGLSATSSSSSLPHSVASSRCPELPEPDLLKAVCSAVFCHPVVEVATHLTRVNMRLAHLILPDDNLKSIERFLPVDMAEADVKALRDSQESWRRGKVSGLATVHLEQGRPLANLLIHRFTSLSFWVVASVTGAGDLAKRRNMLCRMIEIAQHLQSDALADLFGFMAIMRGLQMSFVTRLRTTWANLRRHASSVALIYESQLCQLADDLRSGVPTHKHLIPSLPYLEPVLLLATKTMSVLAVGDTEIPVDGWEVNLDVYALDAVRAHMNAARALCVQCDAYRLAGTARLRGTKAIPELEAYFKRDFPSQLYMSRPGVQSLGQEAVTLADIRSMLQAMSEAAESDSNL